MSVPLHEMPRVRGHDMRTRGEGGKKKTEGGGKRRPSKPRDDDPRTLGHVRDFRPNVGAVLDVYCKSIRSPETWFRAR